MVKFKEFILNENKAYLGQKVGDILNALQDLNDNAEGMGTKYLVQSAEGVVNQIRRILHTDWSKQEEIGLKRLQKVAVAIMKAIEEKDDLEHILQSSQKELENMMGDLDVPINKLSAGDNTV
jgi:hypothetical protein